jgi:hypothetical protein
MPGTPDLEAAETFVLLNARLLERHRIRYLFRGGQAEAVVAALRAYQNPDGGFGHALEPDARGADSQPLPVYFALQVLDEVGQGNGPLVGRAVDYLASITTPDGGVPGALPSVRNAPRAPWFSVEGDAPPASLLPTAGIVGLLHKNRVEHPWLEVATAFCWRALDALDETHPYEIDFCLTFLDHAPDRQRAAREAERLGRLIRERRLVALDPRDKSGVTIPPGYAPGETHSPLDYATRPTSLARGWFSDAEIETNLEALAAAQGEDGGWFFNWRKWNPATTLEMRGLVTLHVLEILRSYGRLADVSRGR